MIGTTWMGEFAKSGGLDPTPADLFEPSAFFEGAWGSDGRRGHSYGVPWYVETRTSVLPDRPGRTGRRLRAADQWDELKPFAQGMQEQGGEVRHLPAAGQDGAWQTFMPFAWQNGAESDRRTANSRSTPPRWWRRWSSTTVLLRRGLSQNTPLEPGALEQGFVDGTIGSFISGPVARWLLDDGGAGEGTFDVVTCCRQGREDRHLVRRWRQPRRLHRRRTIATPPGSSSSCSPRPRPNSSVVRDGQRPALRAVGLGRPARWPTTRCWRCSASSSTTPRRRRPSRPGSRSRAGSTATSRRRSAGRSTRPRPSPHAAAGRALSAPGCRSDGNASPRRRRRSRARPGPTVIAAQPGQRRPGWASPRRSCCCSRCSCSARYWRRCS